MASKMNKRAQPPKAAVVELTEDRLDAAGGIVDPAGPNVVYVGGSRQMADWDKWQEIRSGK